MAPAGEHGPDPTLRLAHDKESRFGSNRTRRRRFQGPMSEQRYRIVNVFTAGDDRLSGNPLCVFEDGRPFSDERMQALARQLNLSETTFVLPPSAPGATARVRIFTPTFEMPFAGHPTLGTAHVVRELMPAEGDRVRLEMIAGIVDVSAQGNTWRLRTARPPEVRSPGASPHELADMLGLPVSALAEKAWELANHAKGPIRCIVFCEKREDAVKTKEEVEKRARGDKKAGTQSVEIDPDLFVGGRRVFERQDAAERLEESRLYCRKTDQAKQSCFSFCNLRSRSGRRPRCRLYGLRSGDLGAYGAASWSRKPPRRRSRWCGRGNRCQPRA